MLVKFTKTDNKDVLRTLYLSKSEKKQVKDELNLIFEHDGKFFASNEGDCYIVDDNYTMIAQLTGTSTEVILEIIREKIDIVEIAEPFNQTLKLFSLSQIYEILDKL